MNAETPHPMSLRELADQMEGRALALVTAYAGKYGFETARAAHSEAADLFACAASLRARSAQEEG